MGPNNIFLVINILGNRGISLTRQFTVMLFEDSSLNFGADPVGIGIGTGVDVQDIIIMLRTN